MTGPESTTALDEPARSPEFDPQASETHPLAEAGKQATASASHLAERAADLGIQQADRGREMAAEGIDRVAQTVRRLSTDMQTDQPQIANAALTAADQAEKVAQYLRENDAREIIGKVEEVARRQPLIFLGGAFVLGVAASRFIKAAAGGGRAAQAGERLGYSTAYRSGSTSEFGGSAGYEPTRPGTHNGNEGF